MGLLERILAMQETAGRSGDVLGEQTPRTSPHEIKPAVVSQPAAQKKKSCLVIGR